ncbi:MAG: Threonylcarbamoyl-AMP synthase [Alphaproteobacteria bacterium ADurb.Bin438]|nr:MAG: Threonylcarbamoyl-AMP synthase [Alphaproteobacteria bacterium ADurb.Bin438]
MLEDDILKGAELIKQGKLVTFPTETVYGLGADAKNDRAVVNIYTAKGRPTFNPLIIHVTDLEEAQKYGEFNEKALKLAEKFWPGPMTLVVKRIPNCKISYMVTSGLDTIAIRIPSHEIARKFLKACGTPVAAPSANASGRVSSTKAEHVRESLGEKAGFIIEGDKSQVGLESTIIYCAKDVPMILRPGIITLEDISAVVGEVVKYDPDKYATAIEGNKPVAPGQLKTHYSPRIPLFMNATEFPEEFAVLAFGKVSDDIHVDLNLSESGDLVEAASNLFDYMRRLDTFPFKGISVMPIPNEGIGVAINDRLKRASQNGF